MKPTKEADRSRAAAVLARGRSRNIWLNIATMTFFVWPLTFVLSNYVFPRFFESAGPMPPAGYFTSRAFEFNLAVGLVIYPLVGWWLGVHSWSRANADLATPPEPTPNDHR